MKRILIAAAVMSLLAAPVSGAFAQAKSHSRTLDLTSRTESVTVTATRTVVVEAAATGLIDAPVVANR